MNSDVPTLEAYEEDSRTACKYGVKCYQKNVKHKKTYKHPPPETEKATSRDEEIIDTKRKRSDGDEREEEPAAKLSKCDTPEEDVEKSIDEMPPSPEDLKSNIKQKFLVDMPSDFYDFWEFCVSKSSDKPSDALSTIGLQLGGPYDLVSGKLENIKTKTQDSFVCHHRFYYDPPEFQTVLVGDTDGYHIGYFRDSPSEDPVFVAEMSENHPSLITPIGPNLFTGLRYYLKNREQSADPFKKTILQKFTKNLESYCKEHKITLDLKTDKMKERNKKVVAKAFHGAGIVVDVDEVTDVGYRELPETNANLKKMLKRIHDSPDEGVRRERLEALQELMTNVQWANDEGDFGMGLELGIDVFMFGGEEFHSSLVHLLGIAYSLLDRDVFVQILKAHLKDRRKEGDMSRLY